MSAVPSSTQQLWQRLADAQLVDENVTGGTGFGRSQGLRISGKIFAMLVDDELVVKLPRERVDALIESGDGRRFDPGHGRLMKEWASVPASASSRWPELVEEAREFVGPKA